MADDAPFARDFGYLIPFLDKVEKAAGALTDPSARAEAMRLAGEEKARWNRLRALLEGAPGGSAAEPGPVRAEPDLTAREPAPTVRAEPGRSAIVTASESGRGATVSQPRAWTVGTLRGRS
jgi:hypothetical protein